MNPFPFGAEHRGDVPYRVGVEPVEQSVNLHLVAEREGGIGRHRPCPTYAVIAKAESISLAECSLGVLEHPPLVTL